MRLDTRTAWALAIAAALAVAPAPAGAWIYPEHRDIAVEGIRRLPPAGQETLQRLWAEALPGYPAKLCPKLSEGDQGLEPGCIDFAAFPALSGDHSCSPQDVLEHVLPSPWIVGVARVSAETKASLAAADSRSAKLNATATNNLKLQVTDPDYATRAGANNAHFELPRESEDMRAYVAASIAEGAPLNSLGLYAQYHIAALALAQRLASGQVPDAQRAATARDVLALEGFSLHWLEDIYAAGHHAGTWGNAAWRKGTHDYYNEFGIDFVDWAGRPVIGFGDGYLGPADLERASRAVSVSLSQLVSALRPGDQLGRLAQEWGPGVDAVRGFDSCKAMAQPPSRGPKLAAYFEEQVERMPKPSKGPGDVHLPRFRDELGPFVSVFGAVGGGLGFGSAAGTSLTSNLAAGLRFGFGADSLTGSVGTGIAFLEGGFISQSAQKGACGTDPACAPLGAAEFYPKVPARTGMLLGLRLPFWLIPGDMLVLAPVLFFTSKPTLSKVGVEAASGGLIPYERSFATSAGIFQIIAGREFHVALYGYLNDPPVASLPIATLPDGTAQYGTVQFKEVQLQFPVLEWTPFRTFATQLTFATQVQLGFSVGLVSTNVVYPAGASFSSGTPWVIWIRGIFDGRYFMGSREDFEPPR